MRVTRPKVGNFFPYDNQEALWVKYLVYGIDLADLQSMTRQFSALIDTPTQYVNFHRQRNGNNFNTGNGAYT